MFLFTDEEQQEFIPFVPVSPGTDHRNVSVAGRCTSSSRRFHFFGHQEDTMIMYYNVVVFTLTTTEGIKNEWAINRHAIIVL